MIVGYAILSFESRIFFVRSNVSVCFPAIGPGSSLMSFAFEMAVSPSSTTSVMSYVALNAGSSNDGNARYSLGGLSAGTIKPGETQQAFAVSMKTTF